MNEVRAEDRALWEARVRQVLKGKGLEALRSLTEDAIEVDALYAPSPRPSIDARAADTRWTILQRVDHPAAGAANELARAEVDNGAPGLVIIFKNAPSARGFGIERCDALTLSLVLRDVAVHDIAIRIEAGRSWHAAAQAMEELLAARSIAPERARVRLAIDPIGASAAGGGAEEGTSDFAQRSAELARVFDGPIVEADGRPYHDGGASDAQELGAVLATAIAYLRALNGKIEDGRLVRAVGMTLSAGCDIFMTLAKFRAARLLWAQVLDECSAPFSPLSLHGETSFRMMARRDMHMNILRCVAATAAAGLGGADSITTLPFSLASGLPDEFARRIARNVQLILMDEAGLHHVADPAGGSGYVDFLTDALMERAFEFMREIEKQGGMATALGRGHVQSAIAEVVERRARELEAGKRLIIGVNAFADASEGKETVV
jgi:methylmalonyl-CoA mutase